MGSVIAWDSLWQISHEDPGHVSVDLLLTMGSPLGQRFIQRRLFGHGERGERRYAKGIRRWINLSALGDLTAIDPELADDFAPMVEHGLVKSIEDYSLSNYFRLNGDLNVHAEYGYLVNSVTAQVVIDWWRSVRSHPGLAE
jgi:hypothetical protein